MLVKIVILLEGERLKWKANNGFTLVLEYWSPKYNNNNNNYYHNNNNNNNNNMIKMRVTIYIDDNLVITPWQTGNDDRCSWISMVNHPGKTNLHPEFQLAPEIPAKTTELMNLQSRRLRSLSQPHTASLCPFDHPPWLYLNRWTNQYSLVIVVNCESCKRFT